MEKKYNTRSPAVKRLMREAAEMASPTSDYFAAPLEENLFEWHFTVRGPEDTDFQGGIYHGRIIVPAEYPMKPPDIIFLTPNGRFEVGKKICLSVTGYHQETWQPSWSIRTVLLAIIGFMPSPGQGTIGSLDYSPEERRALATRSRDWESPVPGLGRLAGLLLPPGTSTATDQERSEAEQIINRVSLKSEEQLKRDKEETKKKEGAENQGSSSDGAVTSQPTSAAPVTRQDGDTSNSNSPRSEQSQRVERPAPRADQAVESVAGGGVVYDVLIMLLVAAIAALLFRRINLMGQEAPESPE